MEIRVLDITADCDSAQTYPRYQQLLTSDSWSRSLSRVPALESRQRQTVSGTGHKEGAEHQFGARGEAPGQRGVRGQFSN